MLKKEDDKIDFQIVHHYIDMNELTLKKLPVSNSFDIFLTIQFNAL